MTTPRKTAGIFKGRGGFTLVEMLVTLSIVAVLAGAAVPLARTAVQREKEIELRRNLRLLREAIDAYKKMADDNLFAAKRRDGNGDVKVDDKAVPVKSPRFVLRAVKQTA